jgi:hypothetical protein
VRADKCLWADKGCRAGEVEFFGHGKETAKMTKLHPRRSLFSEPFYVRAAGKENF